MNSRQNAWHSTGPISFVACGNKYSYFVREKYSYCCALSPGRRGSRHCGWLRDWPEQNVGGFKRRYTSCASSGHDQHIEITKVDDLASLSCSADTVTLIRPLCQDCTWPDLQCILLKIAISIRPSSLDRHGVDNAAMPSSWGIVHTIA